MKIIGIFGLLLFSISLFSFTKLDKVLPSDTYNIYYTYTVPYAVRQSIKDAMDEVSPRQYISSNTVPIFGSLLPDPLNATILNPDTVLAITDSLPMPDIYRKNSRITIHWGVCPDDAIGMTDIYKKDPSYHYFDIVIDSLQYKEGYDLKTILKHEILHGVGLGHTNAAFDGNPASDKIMYATIAIGGSEKFMSQDEVNGLNEMYNKAYFVRPTPEQTGEYIFAVRKDSIDFCTKRDISLTTLFNTAGDSLNPYSIKYRWQYNSNTDYNTVSMRSDSVIYKFDADYNAGQCFMSAFIEGDENMSAVFGASNFRRFLLNDFLVYTPKADTAIVAKVGNYIPVSMKIKDELDSLYEFSNVYNVDSLRVQYVLWNDGFAWLNDSISTSPSIDPRKEFKWYFAQFDSDTTINMNHPDLEVNADYFIKAHLYQKDGENLTYIGTAESGNFDIMPEVMMWIDPTVSENEVFKSTDTTHLITAVCLEPDGTNYGFWGMDYYYKFDDESVWSPIGEIKREKEEIQVDTCTWNCGTKKGYGWLKAVADLSFWNSGECADSMRFVILEADLTFRHFKYDSEGLINSKGGTSLYTTVHKIGADCCYYDNGTYSWVDRIGSASNIHFYYKYPLDEDFTHMTSAVEQIVSDYNYTYYEIELDTGENKDSVTIRIETDVLINGDTVTLTKEKTFGLIDRYLSFTEPKPVGERIVDFESNLKNINDIPSINFWTFGQFQAEEGFDIDKYKDNTQSAYTAL